MIASFIYIAILEHFVTNLPEVPNNQSQLQKDKRMAPIFDTLPIKFDKYDTTLSERGTRQKVITGLYNKKDLELLFKNNEGWY